jgi:hypothetical protein
MRIPARTAASTTLAALALTGLTACGSTNPSVSATSGTAASTGLAGWQAAPMTDAMTGAMSGAFVPTALKPKSTGNPFADVRTAASHMPMSAEILAGGIAKAAKISGASSSDAADLRSGLTYLLTEHVYLAGIAVATAYHAGPDSAAFKAAAAILDDNSKAVAAAVGSVAPKEEKMFLAKWRGHVGDFVTYAVGAKTGGAKGKKLKNIAVKNLTAYAKDQGMFFDRISGGKLPAAKIEKDLMGHILSLAGAVDAFAAGKPAAYGKLKEAAHHMSGTAAFLATGVDKATKMAGNPNDAASGLRAELTRMLTDHVYLAGIAVFTAYTAEGGLTGAAFKGAAGAVDANAVELSKAVGSVAGKANETIFLQSWRAHVVDFVTYAKGAATDNKKVKKTALANLEGYSTASGAFFDKITAGALPAAAVAKDLRIHIETTAGAIDSLKVALIVKS